jgi:phosphoribosyl 1,2-cyclic phosphate phosphodiesterase
LEKAMKIRYLGTAAAEGWPGMFCLCDLCRRARELGGKDIRTRSQAIVDDELLLDFPPDSYLHMQRYGLDLPRMGNVLITHSHYDHFAYRELEYKNAMYTRGDVRALNVYGNDEVCRRLGTLPSEEETHLACHELKEFEPTAIGDYTVTALLALHDRREKCFIYMIEREGKRLLYAHDTGFFPSQTCDYIAHRRFDFMSLDCTMLALPDGNNHMGIRDMLEMRGRLVGMGCADGDTRIAVSHFSHTGKMLHGDIEKALAPEGILVAYDGMTVTF